MVIIFWRACFELFGQIFLYLATMKQIINGSIMFGQAGEEKKVEPTGGEANTAGD
jgi:hypothetical protein